MRIRTIKPEFFLHDALFDAEREEKLPLRIAYVGLWCAADREGRFKWEPRRLGACILPYDDIDFSRVLDACLTRGFVIKYRVLGAWFGLIPSFKRHQVINNREAESLLPDPTIAEELIDASSTRAPRVPHASCARTSGREGKGREGKEIAAGVQPRARNELFDMLVEVTGVNPSISGGEIGTALRAIKEMDPDVTPGEIKRRAINYKFHMKDASMGPNALAKWWAKCATGPAKSTVEKPAIPEPEAWRAWLKDQESLDWRETAATYEWAGLPRHWQEFINDGMKRSA